MSLIETLEYIEVDISSAELLNIGTVSKTILSAPGVGFYYDVQNVIVEYTHGGTSYTIGGPLQYFILDIGNDDYRISTGLVNTPQDRIAQINTGSTMGWNGTFSVPMALARENNQNITFTTNSGSPTVGNGTLKVKMWYIIRTFG